MFFSLFSRREQDAFRKKTAKDRKDDPGKANDVKSVRHSYHVESLSSSLLDVYSTAAFSAFSILLSICGTLSLSLQRSKS